MQIQAQEKSLAFQALQAGIPLESLLAFPIDWGNYIESQKKARSIQIKDENLPHDYAASTSTKPYSSSDGRYKKPRVHRESAENGKGKGKGKEMESSGRRSWSNGSAPYSWPPPSSRGNISIHSNSPTLTRDPSQDSLQSTSSSNFTSSSTPSFSQDEEMSDLSSLPTSLQPSPTFELPDLVNENSFEDQFQRSRTPFTLPATPPDSSSHYTLSPFFDSDLDSCFQIPPTPNLPKLDLAMENSISCYPIALVNRNQTLVPPVDKDERLSSPWDSILFSSI